MADKTKKTSRSSPKDSPSFTHGHSHAVKAERIANYQGEGPNPAPPGGHSYQSSGGGGTSSSSPGSPEIEGAVAGLSTSPSSGIGVPDITMGAETLSLNATSPKESSGIPKVSECDSKLGKAVV